METRPEGLQAFQVTSKTLRNLKADWNLISFFY